MSIKDHLKWGAGALEVMTTENRVPWEFMAKRNRPSKKKRKIWDDRRWIIAVILFIIAGHFGSQSAIPSQLLAVLFFVGGVVATGWATLHWWRGYRRAQKPVTTAAVATDPHDLAVVGQTAGNTLDNRGWRQGMPIALGRELGINAGRAWFPHALVIGATGSGKTTLLRPFVRRWTATGPVAVMSTKGDIIPDALLGGQAGTIHLVTPSGRENLDRDGQARLDALEHAGWTILDTRWDPVVWAGQNVRERAGLVGRCLADVVGGDLANSSFWTSAAAGLIAAGIILESAKIKAGRSSWLDLLDPSAGAGSNALLARSSGVAGVEKMVQEMTIEKLSELAKVQVDPSNFSPVEQSALREILETSRLLARADTTANSRYQTTAVALTAYKYPDETGRTPLDVGKWAASDHDLLAVVVPSSKAKEWAAPMAGLALALWTEATASAGEHLIVLDEMASLAPVPDIESWTAQGRSMGVHVVAVLQNETQADRWAGKGAGQGWILNNWPLALVASGTTTAGLAELLARGEGQHEKETKSISSRGGSSSFWNVPIVEGETTSMAMRDRIEPNMVFDQGVFGVWRIVDRRIGPWAKAI